MGIGTYSLQLEKLDNEDVMRLSAPEQPLNGPEGKTGAVSEANNLLHH